MIFKIKHYVHIVKTDKMKQFNYKAYLLVIEEPEPGKNHQI